MLSLKRQNEISKLSKAELIIFKSEMIARFEISLDYSLEEYNFAQYCYDLKDWKVL